MNSKIFRKLLQLYFIIARNYFDCALFNANGENLILEASLEGAH